MSSTFNVHYWLATSAVQFTGTKKVTRPDHGAEQTAYDANATLITRADMQAGRVSFDVDEGRLQETKITLSLTADGRLSSSNVETTGSGATVLAAVASIAGTVAAVAPVLPVLGVAPVGDGTDVWAHDDLLKTLTAEEDRLASALAGAATDIAKGGAEATTAAKHLDGIDKALTMVAAQRDRLTKERLVWAGGKDTTTTFTYVLDARDLPAPHEMEEGLTSDAMQAAKEVWENLHIMATVEDIGVQSQGDGNGTDVVQGDQAGTSVWYREPRRVKVQVWKADDSQGAAKGRSLVSEQVVDWVDAACTHRSVSFHKDGWFAQNKMSATFGDNGALASVGADVVPGLAGASTALAGLPKEFSTGYGDMTGVMTAWDTAHPTADQKEIAALTAKDKRLSLLAEIAKLQQGASSGGPTS